MTNSIILDVKDLRIRFHTSTKNVVDNISFQVMAGETLAIVGESGSGKSISALSLAKLLPEGTSTVNSEHIIFDKKDLHNLREEDLQHLRGNDIAYVFQEPMSSLNPSHTCGAQVAEVLRIHTDLPEDSIRTRVLKTFEDVSLDDPERIYTSYPHQLSGGQLQRIMIAMAVIGSPKLLIADEPTTALDVSVQQQIISVLNDMQERNNMAILFISHDLGVVRKIADHIIVMKDGNIVEHGKTAEIFEHPKDPYTKGLLASRPSIVSRTSRLHTVQDFIHNHDENKEASPRRTTDLNSAPEILHIEDIHKTYVKKTGFWGGHTSSKIVLNGINLIVKKGETLGIVGESGCGKSTLARIIMKLTPPSAGKILFEGKEVWNLTGKDMKDFRKNVQIVFQDPYTSLNPRTTIGKSITEPMKIHGLHTSNSGRKNAAKHLLEEVGLGEEFFDRYPHQLSGGQRQRVNIARALSVEPRLIIFDESVAALDVSIQAQVLNLLQDLKEKYKLTYLFISHDIAVIYHVSDNVAVMKDGYIEEYGDAEKVIQNPDSLYTRDILNAVME